MSRQAAGYVRLSDGGDGGGESSGGAAPPPPPPPHNSNEGAGGSGTGPSPSGMSPPQPGAYSGMPVAPGLSVAPAPGQQRFGGMRRVSPGPERVDRAAALRKRPAAVSIRTAPPREPGQVGLAFACMWHAETLHAVC